MMTGTVRSINHEKSFGFIQSPGTGDFFFHKSAVRPSEAFGELVIGSKVSFDANLNSAKGPRAENVRVVDEE